MAGIFTLTPLLQAQDELEAILRAEGIKSYTVPIHLQTQDWLTKEFGPGDPYPLNVSLAAKNRVWQTRA